MARDEAELAAAAEGDGTARVRIYRFQPPCITLGRSQDESAIDRGLAAALGYDVVRRPTGGRALLHEDELTYAVVLPPGHALARLGIREAYRVVSAAVVAALGDIGVAARLARPGGSGAPGPGGGGDAPPGGGPRPCFEEHHVESVLVAGRKVCGSAQARRRGAVLQHGTLRLGVDHAREVRLLWPAVAPEAGRAWLEARMGGVFDPPASHPGPGAVARLAAALGARIRAAVDAVAAGSGVVSS